MFHDNDYKILKPKILHRNNQRLKIKNAIEFVWVELSVKHNTQCLPEDIPDNH